MTETSIMPDLLDYPVSMLNKAQRDELLLIKRLCKRFSFNETQSMLIAHMMLKQEPMSIEDLMFATNLSRTSVTTTLSLLESKDFVVKEKRVRVGYYTPIVDFAKLISAQPARVLQEEINPLISLIESNQKETKDRQQQRRYEMLLANLRNTAVTLERMTNSLKKSG